MAYLEVRVENGSKGLMATTANGVSLGKSKGFFASIIGTWYPPAIDYFNALQREGWRMLSAQSNSSMMLVDGLPLGSNWRIYMFEGNGRYEIEWDDSEWHLKGDYDSSYDDRFDDHDYFCY